MKYSPPIPLGEQKGGICRAGSPRVTGLGEFPLFTGQTGIVTFYRIPAGEEKK
jgi:hypothetical protein